jgi:hypothetical protein
MYLSLCTCICIQFFNNDQHSTQQLKGTNMSLIFVLHMRCVQKAKIHHVQTDGEIFYAYCGNTAVDLDPLPVSRAHWTVEELALFE